MIRIIIHGLLLCGPKIFGSKQRISTCAKVRLAQVAHEQLVFDGSSTEKL